VTTEWDNTPWAGTAVQAASLPSLPRAGYKAVTSIGPWANAIPLSTMGSTPQEKAAAYIAAYKVGWFHKAGRKIGGDFANLGWTVSDGDRESDDTESTIKRPDLDIPFDDLSPIEQFQRLMERPNPSYSGRALREKSWIRYKFGGVAFLYLENGQGGGLPTALYGISPTRIWPAYNKAGNIIGWVMDKDSPSGGVPFDLDELRPWSAGSPDDDPFGVSVVEGIFAQVPLTNLMARHTSNVLTTGGRLAGMMWPKDKSLNEDEFVDAQRAWRNVSSDPDAGKRLLIFPEPMEYAAGASTPAEIGIPELAVLNRDEILTGFNLSPYRLGVPSPGGLNSGEVRREDRRDYWEDAVGPDVVSWDEFVQIEILSRYERAMGQTFGFTTDQPNLDDAPVLMEKAAAYKGLVSIGLDPKEALEAVGLGHIKWLGLPDLLDPAKQAEAAAAAAEAKQGDGMTATVGDRSRTDRTNTQQTIVGKAVKAREDVARLHTGTIEAFLTDQRSRVVDRLRKVLPGSKSARSAFIKADPEWFDTQTENELLTATMRTVYDSSGRASLQVVADTLSRIVPNKAVDRIVDDLMEYGGQRIRDINARTLQAITIELAEGARRGYSINQLIDGVPAEGFKGVLNVGMDNGVGVWGDARAETIARTETALSYNRASLGAYREFQVKRVLAYDGDGDPECAARNGREFSVDDAFSMADHPNGTLDWAPVV
jgi:hypothetical protein